MATALLFACRCAGRQKAHAASHACVGSGDLAEVWTQISRLELDALLLPTKAPSPAGAEAFRNGMQNIALVVKGVTSFKTRSG
jgi:hypothetical protein